MDEEWDDVEDGGLRIRSRLEREAGECPECNLEDYGDCILGEDCPYFEEDDEEDDFFDDEEIGDFEDVENIDELLSHDAEAEERISEEERIPEEDLLDEFEEEEPEKIVEYDGDFDEDGNPVDP